MKPGDLVTLSAYGRKLKMFINLHDKVGLVVRADRAGAIHIVRWHGIAKEYHMERKDLKKVK